MSSHYLKLHIFFHIKFQVIKKEVVVAGRVKKEENAVEERVKKERSVESNKDNVIVNIIC